MSTDPPRFSRRQLLGAGTVAALGAWCVRPSNVASDQSLDRPIPPDTWPMFGRDPSRAGYTPASNAPTDGVRVAWKTEVGDPHLALPAIVGNDTVYTTTNHDLVALDAKDGTERWRFSEEFVQGGPAVVGDTVYYSSGVSLYAVAGNHTEWKFQTNSSFEEILPVGNTIFISSYYGNGVKLIALDAESGMTRWTSNDGLQPFAYADGILVGRGDYGLVAVDATTGEKRWHVAHSGLPGDTTFGFGLAPIIADGTLYAGSERLYAVDMNSGEIGWMVEGESTSAVSDGETVYRIVDGTVEALDATDGSRRWRTSDGTDFAAGLALTDEALYAGTANGLVGLNPKMGDERFHFRTGEKESAGLSTIGPPAVAGKRVYMGFGKSVIALEEP